MPITLLSEEVINKIAAGEVIERPASVIKELVENSLDAKATRLLIEVEDYGKELIRVVDNGLGMAEEDAQKSILRHATSKIQTADDLFSITTLGFRGEALASIAAVSRLSLTTKQGNLLAGFNLVVENGIVVSSGITAADQGTTIEVRDLFFNTPARKKFLKTDHVELHHIIDVIAHYALANPSVSFQLFHNGHELLHTPPLGDLRSTIASVYGSETAKELLEIKAQEQGMTIHGFICKPYAVRNDKHQQALFVNGRWIRNLDLVKAIYNGYHSMLFVNKHPVFVLHLQLDPETIDVNVHPQKSEIRIGQKEKICNSITNAVRASLQKQMVPPNVSLPAGKQQTFGQVQSLFVEKKTTTYAFEPTTQTVLHVRETASVSSYLPDLVSPITSLTATQTANHLEQTSFPPLKLLGQIHRTFFVAETSGGFFFIDQHAAHERVLYERFMDQYTQGGIEVQQLLTGELLDLTASEAALCQAFQEELHHAGFLIEAFGGNSYLLKTAPAIFGRQQAAGLLREIIHDLEQKRNRVQELHEEIITRMACRAAVMAGGEGFLLQMEKILGDLRTTRFPYTCPHGRPTLIKTPVEELEKKFKRK